MRHVVHIAALACTAVLAACANHSLQSGAALGADVAPLTRGAEAQHQRPAVRLALPKYVVVIVQENRTVDNLFQGLPGADTVAFGRDRRGQKIKLKPLSLGSQYDPSHTHPAFVTEFNDGGLNGFFQEPCSGCPRGVAYSFVPQNDVKQYFDLVAQSALADHNLQPNEGPSFPGHIYLIAAQSGTPSSHWYISENSKLGNSGGAANCEALSGTTALQIDMTSAYPGTEGNAIFPCIDPPTIIDELDAAGISWRYYTPNTGSIWTAPFAINHLYQNPADRADVIVPETTILSDIANGSLPQVSWVIPRAKNSDHPGLGNNGGPAWVASIVNALGASQYWSQTAVIVVWDDWGGWYDHYLATNGGHPAGFPTDPYEYGLRVPLIAAGPYAKAGYISHVQRDSTSTVHFIEDVYGLSSLGKLDAQTDDLFELFNFGGPAHAHKPIPTGGVTIQQLRMLPPDSTPVDPD